ncbi:hypothetical protein [Dechloromonas sp. ZS-1]|uniref:hypothetical protein n=1 Tax=Dechloromonas sp. ZS-1 TaxID=3138067 RepID=UPI0031FC4AD8
MANQTNVLKEKNNQLTGMSEAAIPATPGLHIVQVPSNLPLIYIRRALEQAVFAGLSAYTLGFEKSQRLIPFLSVSKNQLTQATDLYRNHFSSKEGEQPNVVLLGKNQFDVFSSEGMLYVTLKTGKPRGETVCTMQQQIRSTFQPSQVENFIKLQTHAREKNICFIVFLQSDLAPDAIGCTELADEYILLSRCEPYVGAVTSFSVDSLNRQWLSGLAIGNVQMSTIWGIGGDTKLTTESFIHEKLENRLAWLARNVMVMGPDDVGKLLCISRHSVWRHEKQIFVPTPHILPDPKFIDHQLKFFACPDPMDEPPDDWTQA